MTGQTPRSVLNIISEDFTPPSTPIQHLSNPFSSSQIFSHLNTPSPARSNGDLVIDPNLLPTSPKRTRPDEDSSDIEPPSPVIKKYKKTNQFVSKVAKAYKLDRDHTKGLEAFSKLSKKGMLIEMQANMLGISQKFEDISKGAAVFTAKDHWLENIRARILAALVSPVPHIYGKQFAKRFAALADTRPLLLKIPESKMKEISFAKDIHSAILTQIRHVRFSLKDKIKTSIQAKHPLSQLVTHITETNGRPEIRTIGAHWAVIAFMRSAYIAWDPTITTAVPTETTDDTEASPSQESQPAEPKKKDYYDHLDGEVAKINQKYKTLPADERKSRITNFYSRCVDFDLGLYGGTKASIICDENLHEWQSEIQQVLAEREKVGETTAGVEPTTRAGGA